MLRKQGGVIQLDGWYCTNEIPEGRQCGTWNGLEKDRKECRSCGGPRTAPEGLTREDLFRVCALMIRERNAAVENVTTMQEKLGKYIACAQAAKAFVKDGSIQAKANLTDAVWRLEENPATTAAMKRPYIPKDDNSPLQCHYCHGTGVATLKRTVPESDEEIRAELNKAPVVRCPRCYGTGLVTAGGVSVDCPECTTPVIVADEFGTREPTPEEVKQIKDIMRKNARVVPKAP
jgi:hypothetical protein